jgi:hypothetical protein
MCVAIEADHRVNRRMEDLVTEVRHEIRARLGFNALVECFSRDTLPRYEAKTTRVLHRTETAAARRRRDCLGSGGRSI